MRVKLLCEELIAVCDTDGKLDLISEYDAHRRVSLCFRSNEESGLRCTCHSWKYDVNGQCVDISSEPKGSKFCDKGKLPAAYRCVERGGTIWAYMAHPENIQPLPEFEWAMVPDSHRYVRKRLQECNYM